MERKQKWNWGIGYSFCFCLKVEEQRQWKEGALEGSDKDEDGETEEVVDKVAIYQQILNILKPGETVVKVGTCSIYMNMCVCCYFRLLQD